MTESNSPKVQPGTGESGLTDCAPKEPKLEPEEELTYQSLTKSKPNPKSRGKRKRQNNWGTTKHANNRKSTNNLPTSQTKRQKAVKDTQNDTSAPEAKQQINSNVLTEDEYIIAYIKEEVEEEQILQLPVEINSDQMPSFSTLPQIKDEPESSEPSTVHFDKVSPPPPAPSSPKISDSLIYNQTQVSTITAPNSMSNSPKQPPTAPEPVVKRKGSLSHFSNRSSVPDETRFDSVGHWPGKYGMRSIESKSQVQIRNRCKRSKCNKISAIFCEKCQVALCINPCFKMFHTSQ